MTLVNKDQMSLTLLRLDYLTYSDGMIPDGVFSSEWLIRGGGGGILRLV